MGAASSPLAVNRSPVRSSIEKIHLLGCDQYGHLDRLLCLVEVRGFAGPAGGFPRVVVFIDEGDFAELRLAEPESVPLVGALPERLVFRCPLQRSSSAPASSRAGLRLRRLPSGARRSSAPSSSPSRRAPCAPGAARRGSWWFPRAAPGSSRP